MNQVARVPAAGAVGGLALLLVCACGAGQSTTRKTGGGSEGGFACNDRRAEYLLVGGFAAAEVGLSMACGGNRATLTKWYVDDGSSERQSETFDIFPAEFERLWQQLEDAGWRNLEDCSNPGAANDEEIATFDITDGENTVSLTCQGKQQPFPFDRLANAFDELSRSYEVR